MNWLAGGLCLADEANENVDSVLSRWEEASQNCQTLDAKLIVYQYDLFHDKQPAITQGRFYYEAPKRWTLRNRERSGQGTTNDWSNLRDVIIWRADENALHPPRSARIRKTADGKT